MRDAKGCENDLNPVTIVEPDPLTARVSSTNETCLTAGTITVTEAANSFSGLYQFSIDNWKSWNTNGLFVELAPDDYAIQIRDALLNSCERTISTVTITSVTPLEAHAEPTAVTCFGGNRRNHYG